jgi:uncharacterized protein with von Willebrand factor type A (vWA) domain
LGVDEYQAALKAVEAGFAQDETAFVEMVQILWCHSRSQQNQLVPIWQDLQREAQKLKDPLPDRKDNIDPPDPKLPEQVKQQQPDPEPLVREIEVQPKQEVASLPVQAPFIPIEREGILSLQNYFPLPRRSMVYGWRFLRRPVADGCKNVLDIPATIQGVTEQGYYLAPVYRRQQRNGARLLLLIDQNGSMMPFHRFARDLVETAREESLLQEENVQVFYFHNVPTSHVYQDLYLTSPVPIKEVLGQCDGDTSVLIVSDAGAARGYRRQERIQDTTRFLLQLQKQTRLIAWLNPMSRPRWVGSSAEILSYLVPMFQMDRFGFAEAIDVMRGLAKASVQGDEE